MQKAQKLAVNEKGGNAIIRILPQLLLYSTKNNHKISALLTVFYNKKTTVSFNHKEGDFNSRR